MILIYIFFILFILIYIFLILILIYTNFKLKTAINCPEIDINVLVIKISMVLFNSLNEWSVINEKKKKFSELR